MSNRRATHMGECQICHNMQKLPKGKMSIHGYTRQFGWFQGKCAGSGHLPLEQSCDLIQWSIDATKASIVRYEDVIQKAENSTDTYYYKKQINPKTEERVYESTTIIDIAHDLFWEVKKEVLSLYCHYLRLEYKTETQKVTKEDIATSKKYYIRYQKDEVERQHKYIAGQQSIVENWEPKPLTEI